MPGCIVDPNCFNYSWLSDSPRTALSMSLAWLSVCDLSPERRRVSLFCLYERLGYSGNRDTRCGNIGWLLLEKMHVVGPRLDLAARLPWDPLCPHLTSGASLTASRHPQPCPAPRLTQHKGAHGDKVVRTLWCVDGEREGFAGSQGSLSLVFGAPGGNRHGQRCLKLENVP